jgi:hypothetical protein
MARPSQAITFPEVFINKYGDARGFVPTDMGAPMDIMKGTDEHGWYKNSVQTAMDRVNQIASSKRNYLAGVRPFQALQLKRNAGGIVPFGVNSRGGQFEAEPFMSSRGELRGGIMFTKAGQDYIQTLLNQRQRQYAEMGDRTVREQPTAFTDPTLGKDLLSQVMPLYNVLLDDLRTLTVKSATSFNSFWAMMLSVMPQLGSNFRSNLLEIADTLAETVQGAEEQVKRDKRTSKRFDQLFALSGRILKAIEVIRLYCGEALRTTPAPIDGVEPLRREALDEIVKATNMKMPVGIQARYNDIVRRIIEEGVPYEGELGDLIDLDAQDFEETRAEEADRLATAPTPERREANPLQSAEREEGLAPAEVRSAVGQGRRPRHHRRKNAPNERM